MFSSINLVLYEQALLRLNVLVPDISVLWGVESSVLQEKPIGLAGAAKTGVLCLSSPVAPANT